MRCISIRTLIAGSALTLATVVPAAADFKVQMPDAETGEVSIEPLGDYGHDPRAAHSGELSTTQEFEYGVNGFWRTELELEQERDAGPGQSYQFSQVTSENIFQFTERGQYWVDAGFFAEFGRATIHGDPNEFTLGPIFRKEIFRTINTVNLFLQKEVGSNSASTSVFRVRLGNADLPSARRSSPASRPMATRAGSRGSTRTGRKTTASAHKFSALCPISVRAPSTGTPAFCSG